MLSLYILSDYDQTVLLHAAYTGYLILSISSFLSFHAAPLRMEMFAAQLIWTAFRTTKALLLLLSCSPPFTAGLPCPLPPSDNSPLGFMNKTDSRTHMCMPVCAQEVQTHTGRTGGVEAVLLCRNSVDTTVSE